MKKESIIVVLLGMLVLFDFVGMCAVVFKGQSVVNRSTGSALGLEFSQDFNRTGAVPTNTKIVVSTVSTQIVGTSTQRKYLAIVNDSGRPMYLGIGVSAVGGVGYMLPATSTYEVDINKNPFISAIYGISSSSAAQVTVIEKN